MRELGAAAEPQHARVPRLRAVGDALRQIETHQLRVIGMESGGGVKVSHIQPHDLLPGLDAESGGIEAEVTAQRAQTHRAGGQSVSQVARRAAMSRLQPLADRPAAGGEGQWGQSDSGEVSSACPEEVPPPHLLLRLLIRHVSLIDPR